MHRFNKDDWDEAFDELVYDKELEEETDESARYFDVPMPYRPIQLNIRQTLGGIYESK